MTHHRLTLVLLFAWLLLVFTRILGPSDIYDKEQPRTIAYTADMLVNHHWILPYDTFAIPATKPPLYNWISVPAVAAFGYQEWALKIPSILASLIIILCLAKAGRHLKLDPAPDKPSWQPQTLGLIAALLYLATPMTAKLLYVARPDMLLTACLFAAWLAATIMIQSPKPVRAAQLAFWLCTAAAAFTKGPSALLSILYLLLAAKLLSGKWSTLNRTGWSWGLPLLLLSYGGYTYLAYQQEPEFYRQVLLGRELAGRVAKPGQLFATLFNGPLYIITRSLPWSLVAILLLVRIPLRKWFAHPLAPAILWLLIILATMSFMTTKRPDRYAPVMPAVALLAAAALVHIPARFRLTPTSIATVALLMILSLAVANQFFSNPADTHAGDHAILFAQQVKKITGNDPILFTDGELTPVESLLGQAQLRTPSPETLSKIRWHIGYYQPGPTATLLSLPLAEVSPPGRLALYPLAPGQAIEQFQQSQAEPKNYLGNATTNSPVFSATNPNATRWSQFSRPHIHENSFQNP